MALTWVHDDWDYGSYEADRNEHVAYQENHTNDVTRPYYDSSIAIAFGYDLLQRIHAQSVTDPVTHQIRYRGTAPEIISDLNAVNNALGLQGAQRVTITQADINLLAEAKLRRGRRIRQLINNNELALTFPSRDFSLKLLDIYLDRYETSLNNVLGGAQQLPQSKERIAVMSLAYHMTNGTEANIRRKLGTVLRAISNDNRAEAWYLMRYTLNPHDNSYRARRCYAESDFFDLYDAGTLAVRNDANDAQAKEVMRMYTLHELEAPQASRMSTYDTLHATDRTSVNAGDIDCEVVCAKEYLINNFTPLSWLLTGETINGQVRVGRGLASYAYLESGNYADDMTGSNQNDLIFGERGNDTLRDEGGNDVVYGGQGNDHFYSNSGNDFLYGGEDNDWYYVNNDGSENRTVRIEDKDGDDNRVFINGRQLVRFYRHDAGLGYEYRSADGRFTGTYEGLDFVVTENGSNTRVILNEDFQEGEFGIRFYDELTPSDNPVTDNVVQGDQDPQNLNDTLEDTTGNDLILCGAGDDSVKAWQGGEDWISRSA